MTTPLLKTILVETYSIEQLERRIRKMRSHFIYKLFGEQSEVESDSFSDPIDIKWFFEISTEELNRNFNRENVYQVFDNLHQEIKNLQPLVTYFAYNFPETELITMAQNLRKNYSSDLLLNIKIDPTLIGGCAFIINGTYKDFSLKNKIDRNKDFILAEFTGYLNATK